MSEYLYNNYTTTTQCDEVGSEDLVGGMSGSITN